MNAPHKLNNTYTFLALSAFIFLVLFLPVQSGRLSPEAYSIFNIVSSVTHLSPWGAGCPLVCREGVLFVCCCFFVFFLFFFCCFDQAFPMGFTQSHCQTAVLTRAGQICLKIETKGVLYCTEK